MTQAWDVLFGFALFVSALLGLPLFAAWRTLLRPAQRVPAAEQLPGHHEIVAAFELLIERQFRHLLALARTQGTLRGETENGRAYIVLGTNSYLASEISSGTQRIRSFLIAAGHLDIPGELVCERDIYAEGRINVGHNTMVKSILSPRDIAVGNYARVVRWARSERRIDFAENAQSRGFASAGIEITLARRTRFEHLIAPRIAFGRLPDYVTPPSEINARFHAPEMGLQPVHSAKSLDIPARHVAKGDLNVSDQLTIAENCRIIGNLRAGRQLEIGRLSTIEGAIYCDGDITIHDGCRILGPIVAQGQIKLASACLIGLPEHPTTLTAQRIQVGEGCIAHGTVWARERGEVTLAESSL